MSKKDVKGIGIVLLICWIGMLGVACAFPFEGEEPNQKELTLYYVNKEYLDNENIKNVFVEYSKKRPTLPKELENASDDEKASYLAVGTLIFLKEVPVSISEKATTVVSSDVVINNVTIKYGVAVVDISAESLEKLGGSMDESLFISQIVSTILSSFDEVTSVQFMVDGKEVDSLMGHIDTSEPFVAPTIR